MHDMVVGKISLKVEEREGFGNGAYTALRGRVWGNAVM